MNFNDFILQRNMNFKDFPIFFITSLGIDFKWLLVSISAPCWYAFVIKFHVFWWSFFLWFVESILDWFLIIFDQKWFQRVGAGSLVFRSLFRHTCTFYHCKTYKCQNPLFPIFPPKKKHTHLYLLPTYYLQVRHDRFLPFSRKNLMEKSKKSNIPRHDFGPILASVGILLGSF